MLRRVCSVPVRAYKRLRMTRRGGPLRTNASRRQYERIFRLQCVRQKLGTGTIWIRCHGVWQMAVSLQKEEARP